MRGVESNRGQHGHDFAEEVVANPFSLRIGPLRATQEADAFARSRRQQGVIKFAILISDQTVNCGRHLIVSLLRQQAVGCSGFTVPFNLFFKPGHADFKELIQVG